MEVELSTGSSLRAVPPAANAETMLKCAIYNIAGSTPTTETFNSPADSLKFLFAKRAFSSMVAAPALLALGAPPQKSPPRMPYPIDKKLVVAVSSTALFDFSEEHRVFMDEGLDAFRKFQRDNRSAPPPHGAAFPFIRRLLTLNKVYSEEQPVEVVILSRNHPDAGLRVMDSVKHYELPISRSFFLAGSIPYPYMKSVHACLYLSTNPDEVREAVHLGYPAGHVLPYKSGVDNISDIQLRLAFDFDGVIVDDEAELIYQGTKDLELFHHYEQLHRDKPLREGPLMPLLKKISFFQKLERKKATLDPTYTQHLRISIVTARNAPSHERLINTLASLDIETDELFLMGGIEKKNVLDVLKPHIFFDDQLGHLTPAAETTPSVHIPFGIANKQKLSNN
jgi:5'-nucleotidase